MKLKKDEAKGKLRTDLVPADWFLGDAEVLTFGNDKGYPEYGYLGSDPKLFKAAALRHLMAYLNGESVDPESGLSHLKHVRVNLGILMDIEQNRAALEEELYNEAIETLKEI